jgi:hypothetical protein
LLRTNLRSSLWLTTEGLDKHQWPHSGCIVFSIPLFASHGLSSRSSSQSALPPHPTNQFQLHRFATHDLYSTNSSADRCSLHELGANRCFLGEPNAEHLPLSTSFPVRLSASLEESRLCFLGLFRPSARSRKDFWFFILAQRRLWPSIKAMPLHPSPAISGQGNPSALPHKPKSTSPDLRKTNKVSNCIASCLAYVLSILSYLHTRVASVSSS